MLKRMPAIIWILFVALLQNACRGANSDVEPWPEGDASYTFVSPDAEFKLEGDLDEISGLATMKDGMLAAVEDERGELFILDPSTGEVVSRKEFGKKGDYEAVEVAGDRVFVLRSDGKLFELAELSGNKISPAEHDLDIPRNCDAEGLAFDSRRLLLSCKEDAGKNLGKVKAIYGVDLTSKKLSGKPVFTIDPARFSASGSDNAVNDAVRSAVSGTIDLSGFKPSDLAVHPLTGELFIISSVRTAIIVLDRSGRVTKFWNLPDGLMEQPEGIAFLPNGDMWLASEAGSKKSARLLRFNFRRDATNRQP